MNMTGFVHPHQKKRHDEANSGPLETPDGQFKHFGLNSTARTAALNHRPLRCLVALAKLDVGQSATGRIRRGELG